ncbi:MAG: dihydroneopterin aldolase [Actinobacteria bacterium]|nr:dihydroneopterin aldolase [Actinomycetota bacterium]
MDRITLHGIEVWAHHGIRPDERRSGQPFVVDVTVDLDLSAAAVSDDLSDTVDYATVASDVAAAAAGGPYHLLESVAGRILDAVLGHRRVAAAEVTVNKPHAPLPVPAAGVSVTLRRTREP